MSNKELIEKLGDDFEFIIEKLNKGDFKGEIITSDVDDQGNDYSVVVKWELKLTREV